MKRKLYIFSSPEKKFLDSGDDEFFSLNYQKALEIYSQAIELYPESYLVHECLGVTQAKLGLLVQAQRSFKCAIELNMNYSSAHNNLGMVYFLQEKFDLAEFYIRKALVLEPNNIDFKSNMALCLNVIPGGHSFELNFSGISITQTEIPLNISSFEDAHNSSSSKTRRVEIFNISSAYKSGYIVDNIKEILVPTSKSETLYSEHESQDQNKVVMSKIREIEIFNIPSGYKLGCIVSEAKIKKDSHELTNSIETDFNEDQEELAALIHEKLNENSGFFTSPKSIADRNSSANRYSSVKKNNNITKDSICISLSPDIERMKGFNESSSVDQQAIEEQTNNLFYPRATTFGSNAKRGGCFTVDDHFVEPNQGKHPGFLKRYKTEPPISNSFEHGLKKSQNVVLETAKLTLKSLVLASSSQESSGSNNNTESAFTPTKKIQTDCRNSNSPVGVNEIENFESQISQGVTGFSLLAGESRMYIDMSDES